MVDASLLHPITGQCPPILWRRLATLSKVSTRGVATGTYRNARGGMILVGHAVGARPPGKSTRLHTAAVTKTSAATWARPDLDAGARSAISPADELSTCPAGQNVARVTGTCPALATATQPACIRPGHSRPAQCRATAGTGLAPLPRAHPLPSCAGAPLHLFSSPFAERALGP